METLHYWPAYGWREREREPTNKVISYHNAFIGNLQIFFTQTAQKKRLSVSKCSYQLALSPAAGLSS